MSQQPPLACDLSVFTPGQRAYHVQLTTQINSLRQSIRELDDGYAFQLPLDAYHAAAEFLGQEHRCCPFFRLMLEIEPGDGSIWLYFRGSSQIKAFVEQEFGLT